MIKAGFRLFGATLSVGLLLSGGQLARADSQVSVYPGQQLQRIDGFGASDAWYAWAIHAFPTASQTAILDDLFSTTSGAGLSLLRHRVPPEIEPSAGVWDWTKDNDTVWLSQQAVSRGVAQVWGTVWSPPAWMKTNNDVNNGGAVAPSHYQDYATFLATYVKHYSASFGVNISAISIANEPDMSVFYESSNWTSQQFHDFIASNLAPTFRTAGLQTSIMLPELSGWSDWPAAATLADPATASAVSIIATHNYWGSPSPFWDALNANKTVWETEVSNLGGDDPSIDDGLAWALSIHHTLVDAHANAWHYWWLYSDVSDTTGQSLISGSPSTNKFVTKKRLWTIGNFSRFVRPGWRMLRISSNNPESGVYVTAFIGPMHAMSIVAINTKPTATRLSVNTGLLPAVAGPISPGLAIKLFGQARQYRTSATEDLALTGPTATLQNQFLATLAARSVTTFVIIPPNAVLAQTQRAQS